MNLYAVPPVLGTVMFLLLGLFTLTRRPVTKQKIIFGLLCLETFHWQLVWLLSFFLSPSPFQQNLSKIAYLTITFIPPTFYHFIVAYTQKKSENNRSVYLFYWISLVLAILIFPTDLIIVGNRQFDWGYFVMPGKYHPVFAFFALVTMVCALVILFRYKRQNVQPELQNRSKYLLVGTALYFLCNLDLLQVYGASWYPVGSLFFLMACFVIAYAIFKHNLLDIHVVLQKTIFYSAISICVSFVYILLVFVFCSLVLKSINPEYFKINFASVLFVAVTFKPIEVLCHKFLMRSFFKGTISEISEQKTKLESVVERQQRLQSVGILAAGMAHEIKNPLTSLQTFAEYLPTKYDDPAYRDKFSKIVVKEVGRIRDIVQSLLDFSKPKEPNISRCDLRRAVAEIVDFMSSDLLRDGVAVQYSGETLYVLADENQLKQVFLNLISNAADSVRGQVKGLIQVHIGRAEGLGTVTIIDNGCGIAPDRIGHIFDPFYTSKDKGAGLGLAITHSIIQRNNGAIRVQSRIGVGSQFTIELPLTH